MFESVDVVVKLICCFDDYLIDCCVCYVVIDGIVV